MKMSPATPRVTQCQARGWSAQDGDEEEESPLGLFKQQMASSGEASGPEVLIWGHRGPRWSKAVLGSLL